MLTLALALVAGLGVHAVQPSAPSAIPAELRDLPWGQLNILHTTDTHGWHAGHLQEASYSGDWGDYISFAHHMRKLADDKGVDLILVDTGDRIEGNGLYDASEPKGKYTFDIFKHQEIEVICSGNHELYKANSSENELFQTVPNFKGHYLASNLDIYNPRSGETEPLAKRFRKFKTKNLGIKITAFGFLYNFDGNANNTIVKKVEDTIKEQWFQDAIRDRDTDVFLVAGHVAAESEEYKAVYKAIRDVQWDVPIQFMAGHTHIRDYRKYDEAAYALESGRYMETVGFGSIGDIRIKGHGVTPMKTKPQFKRRYIDNNLYSYFHHTGLNETTFPTKLGKNVTAMITDARSALDLDKRYGCAPHDYWMSRVGIEDDESIFKWLGDEVIPKQLSQKNSTRPKLVISNTGAIRFDIFKGNFTRDSTFLVSPFTSGFRYVKDVDYSTAQRLLAILNHGAPIIPGLDESINLEPLSDHNPHRVNERRRTDDDQLASRDVGQIVLGNRDKPKPIPGYITHDALGDEGDDTIHSEIPWASIPSCIQSKVDFKEDEKDVKTVDIVYNAFVERWILQALNALGEERAFKDTAPYFKPKKSMTDVIAEWVSENWDCKD